MWLSVYGKALQDMENRFCDLAMVSYSRVYPEFQRRGIATAMYLEMAYQLEKRYYIKLRASDCQSKAAAALWKSFEEKGLTKTWEGFMILNPPENSPLTMRVQSKESMQEMFQL